MKTISIRPPWTWAIFHAGKDIENRTWGTHYRGPLCIHASKTFDYEGYHWLLQNMPDIQCPLRDSYIHIYGSLLGTVNMIDCINGFSAMNSPWFFGPFGFVFRDSVEFTTPIPYRGKLGFFNVPDELLEIK